MLSRRLSAVLALGLALLSASAAAAGEEQAIRERLRQAAPQTKVVAVRPSPMPGLFEVELADGLLYASADGQFVLQGELLQLKGRQLVNITEQAQAVKRIALLKTIDRADEAIFLAKGKPRAVLTVFTDINCGYCRKLHQEVPAMNAAGIEVRYLAYPRDLPRTGPNAGTTAAMSAIWCNANREQALTLAKQGQEVPAPRKDCKSPVVAQHELGQRMGVNGTPAIFAEDGRQLGGYVTAAQAVKLLGLN